MSQDAIRRLLELGTLGAILDAHESAQAIATWDPALVRDDRLLVPVDVRALVVHADAPSSSVVTFVDPPRDGSWPTPPAPFGEETKRAPGVYVHVAMPDGLTRGARKSAGASSAAGNPMQLPPLPDRVVVVRLLHGSTKRRAWILLGDRAERADLEGFAARATTEDASRLTAVSGGDPAWAATYDATQGRFSMHDDLADLSAAEIEGHRATYLVMGFWSDAKLDPLDGLATVASYEARLAELGWFSPPLPKKASGKTKVEHLSRTIAGLEGVAPATASPTLGGAPGAAKVGVGIDPRWTGAKSAELLRAEPLFPTKTLLHGVVFGVALDGRGPDLRPSPSAIEVGVGGSSMAALASLLAGADDATSLSRERLLAAFFSQRLDRVDTPDGLADVDEDRHGSTFTGLPGGQRAKPDRIGEGSIEPTGPKPASAGESRRVDLFLGRTRFGKKGGGKPERPRASGTRLGTRTFRDVPVAMPRFWVPSDPSIVLRGARRSERHGGDGRYEPDGRLHCRLPHEIARAYSGVLDAGDLPFGLRTLGSGAVPPECNALLAEAVLSDPFRVGELVAWARRGRELPVENARTRIAAELALRHAPTVQGSRRASTVDAAYATDLRKASLLDGVDPSPVATTIWAQPWVPLWLDYELEVAVDDTTEGWVLRGPDLEPERSPVSEPERILSRVLLTGSSATGLAAQIRRWLDDENRRDAAGQGTLSEGEESELSVLADAADGLDVLTGTFGGLRSHFLGFEATASEATRVDAEGSVVARPSPKTLPRLLASGRARIVRARVVDAFGRFVDVPEAALHGARVASTHRAPEGDGRVVLRPRFQAPARTLFRFVDPTPADDAPIEDARIDEQSATGGVSPVAGWLLPDHVDEALEFFDAAGEALGQLMHDASTGAVVWEGAPGRPGALGHAPDAGASPSGRHLERLAVGLIKADATARALAEPPSESALSALLRAVDTTLWTVDPFHHFGSGSVAGLVGRPIAVVRAAIVIEVASDVSDLTFASPADGDARAAAFSALARRVVEARLGAITRTDDGLLAYAVDDDYTSLRPVAGDVRARAKERIFGGSETPIDHPYLTGDSRVQLQAGRMLRLTLLMVPGASVTLTTGILPEKRIALARAWFEKTLERLSPSFRVGPVLLDAGTVRLPKVSGLGKKQRFTHKPTALDWRDDPIEAATQTAFLPELPSIVREGWIRVASEDEEPTP